MLHLNLATYCIALRDVAVASTVQSLPTGMANMYCIDHRVGKKCLGRFSLFCTCPDCVFPISDIFKDELVDKWDLSLECRDANNKTPIILG